MLEMCTQFYQENLFEGVIMLFNWLGIWTSWWNENLAGETIGLGENRS
jgi:hypothetical protein